MRGGKADNEVTREGETEAEGEGEGVVAHCHELQQRKT